eukprot:COSAG03_NODE_29_length_18724_cov_58.310497_14_plen_81_part_00
MTRESSFAHAPSLDSIDSELGCGNVVASPPARGDRPSELRALEIRGSAGEGSGQAAGGDGDRGGAGEALTRTRVGGVPER